MNILPKSVAALLVASGLVSALQADCGNNLGVFRDYSGPGWGAAGGGAAGCYYIQIPLQRRGSCIQSNGNNCDIQGETIYGYSWWAPGNCGNAQTATPPASATKESYNTEKAGPTNGACPPGA